MTVGDEWGAARRSAAPTTAADYGEGRRTAPRSYPGTATRADTASTPAQPSQRGPRRAKLQLRRIDPWSVMKFSLVLSIVLCVVLIVAAAVLYLLLAGMGVFDSVNETVRTISGQTSAPIFTAKSVIGVASVIGLVDIVLFTAMATLGAFAYNLCADLVGGIEVTLAEHD